MNILINASGIKAGGGIQVADSICGNLNNFSCHNFIVVLSSYLNTTRERIQEYKNITIYDYDSKNDFWVLLTGRNKYLDDIVKKEKIDIVFSVFGPTSWCPQVSHLQGFARPHLVLRDSQYFTRMSYAELLKSKLHNWILGYFFQRSSKHFWTENPYISEKLKKLFKGSQVFTVTNYYNQVYDHPEKWINKQLPKFDGITLLTITASYPHKNLPISVEIAEILNREHPNFKFRFVFTIDACQFPEIPERLKKHFLFIGRVDIAECPSLYEQADIMFQPTLLECFTATYPEAMKMCRPIVTTDIEFARGLCGDAAVYYSPLSAIDAANAIYSVATNETLRNKLISEGEKQLTMFDDYTKRTEKLISIMQKINN